MCGRHLVRTGCLSDERISWRRAACPLPCCRYRWIDGCLDSHPGMHVRGEMLGGGFRCFAGQQTVLTCAVHTSYAADQVEALAQDALKVRLRLAPGFTTWDTAGSFAHCDCPGASSNSLGSKKNPLAPREWMMGSDSASTRSSMAEALVASTRTGRLL